MYQKTVYVVSDLTSIFSSSTSPVGLTDISTPPTEAPQPAPPAELPELAPVAPALTEVSPVVPVTPAEQTAPTVGEAFPLLAPVEPVTGG